MKRSTFLKTLVAVPAAIAAVSQAEPTIEQETIRAIIKRSDAAQKVLLDSFYNPQFGGYLIPRDWAQQIEDKGFVTWQNQQ